MARILLSRLPLSWRRAGLCMLLATQGAALGAQAKPPSRSHAVDASIAAIPAPPAKPRPALPASVTRAFARARIPLDALSILVVRTGDNAPILQWNADAAMNPASTMKLLTTFAGLDLLGPNFRWRTHAYADRVPVDGRLDGNLYLRGQGDPKLIPEELIKLVTNVRRAGIDTLAGSIVLDRSYFESKLSDSPPLDDNLTRPYNVAPDALLYAFKTLTFTLTPAAGAVNIEVSPPLAQLRVSNQLRPTRGRCRNPPAPSLDPAPQADGALYVRFQGPYARTCGQRLYNLATLGHADFIWGGFLALWQQAGGTWRTLPSLREGRVPRLAVLLATHDSPTLADVVRDINKYSNNVMARQLFLTLGAELGRPPASVRQSTAVIHQWLARQNLTMPELVLENGSGLSRIERISARNLSHLLLQANASPHGAILRESLPIAGVDGTLRHRLIGARVAGHARIKTGTLDGVRAMAGYVESERGERVVVVSLINHPNAEAGQAAHDALLQWIHRGASR